MHTIPSTTEIDPSGRIRAEMYKASESRVRIYKDARNRHVFASADSQHRSDDGVVAAFDEFASAIHELHDNLEGLSEWTATHDAVLQPTTGQTFDSVDTCYASWGGHFC